MWSIEMSQDELDSGCQQTTKIKWCNLADDSTVIFCSTTYADRLIDTESSTVLRIAFAEKLLHGRGLDTGIAIVLNLLEFTLPDTIAYIYWW